MRKALLLLVAAAAIVVTPVAAQRLRYLSPQDVAEAQRDHAALVRELGGAETGPRAAYAESVGRRVGNYAGIANPGQSLHSSPRSRTPFRSPGGTFTSLVS